MTETNPPETYRSHLMAFALDGKTEDVHTVACDYQGEGRPIGHLALVHVNCPDCLLAVQLWAQRHR